MDGVKELVDLTNEALGENSKYVAKDKERGIYGAGYYINKI